MTENLRNGFFFVAGVFASFFCFQNTVFASDFSTPLSNLSNNEKFEFYIGENVFKKFWVPSPSSTTASDGLGPLFNTRSCNNCHINNGRGHAPEANINGISVPSFLIRLGKSYPNQNTPSNHVYPHIGDKTYGHQFQSQSTTGISPEGDYYLTYQTHTEVLSDGTKIELRKPQLHWRTLHYGNFEESTGFTMLASPALVGMGLLDSIPDKSILANADPNDSNNDGISGRVNWLDEEQTVIGRFGYKASVETVDQQNQSAFHTDLGLSTPLNPTASGDCTSRQRDCLNSPNGNSPHLNNLEVDEQQMRLVNLFVSLSSPPAMRNLKTTAFLEGKRVFDAAEAGGAILFFDEADALFGKLNSLLFRQMCDGGLGCAVSRSERACAQASRMQRLRVACRSHFHRRAAICTKRGAWGPPTASAVRSMPPPAARSLAMARVSSC